MDLYISINRCLLCVTKYKQKVMFLAFWNKTNPYVTA